jgi:hypothetical protein
MKTTYKPAFAALRRGRQNLIVTALACAFVTSTARAQNTSAFNSQIGDDAKNEEAELAKKLQNPVASLISVPIQNNWDFGIGPANAMKYTANIQPVIPVSISQGLEPHHPTILPVIYAESPVKGGQPIIPVWATSRRVSSFRPRSRWAAGFWAPGRWVRYGPRRPTARWVPASGAPGRPSWRCSRNTASPTAFWPTRSGRYAGWGRQNVNASFVQPFISYTTKTYTTFAVNTESTYDWQSEQATVPMNFMVQQLVKIGKHPSPSR